MTRDEALSSLFAAQLDLARACDLLYHLYDDVSEGKGGDQISETFDRIVGLIEGRDETVIDAWNVLDPEEADVVG
jgi:hypothetical protein